MGFSREQNSVVHITSYKNQSDDKTVSGALAKWFRYLVS